MAKKMFIILFILAVIYLSSCKVSDIKNDKIENSKDRYFCVKSEDCVFTKHTTLDCENKNDRLGKILENQKREFDTCVCYNNKCALLRIDEVVN